MNKLPPFKWFVLQNFPFIEEDFDAITNYQLLCKVVEYLNKTIDKTNELGEQVETLMNWFNNLDVQDEVDNKLDEMVEDGTLAEIINQQIFDELNTRIENIENTMYVYPYYDMYKNEADNTGTTPCDTIFSSAKTAGYRKFYFSSGEYYFTTYPNLDDCIIYNDKDVVLSFPNMSSIDSTKNGIFKNNISIYSRAEEKTYLISKNESDFYNQFYLPKYSIISPTIKRLNSNDIKVYSFDYSEGIYVDETSNKTDIYQNVGYDIRYKSTIEYGLFCVPLDRTKNECVEIVSTPNTHIAWGAVDSTSLHGIYSTYLGIADGQYYYVNETSSPSATTNYSTLTNIYNHNGLNSINNDYSYAIKYKLRNNIKSGKIELYVNDNFVEAIPYGADVDYFGFGIFESSTPNISSDNGFSEPLCYEQKEVPLNCNLKILIAGDSRTYGYNQQYKIEDIITNGLKNNGINKVEIDNISVSGATIENIKSQLQNEILTNYDIVILNTGINNYSSSYQTILQNAYDIMNLCIQNNCLCIVPATIPTCNTGTDALAATRTQQYYKIQQAVISASGYFDEKFMIRILPNVLGITTEASNEYICSDGVHPTTEGMILYSKSIVNEILNLFN